MLARVLSVLFSLFMIACAAPQRPVPSTAGVAAASGNASAASASASSTPSPASALKPIRSVEGIVEYRLDNGLQVLLYADPSKPTVTVNLTCLVGSRQEGYGESGMAHLLEHMLFKGTPNRPDIWKLLQDHGADFNGTTEWDRTNFYEELPASPENLEFAISLEADRLVNSKIAPEDLHKEFSVVRNEFEIDENDPASVLEEKMLSVAYQWHNYGKATIGPRSDIERVSADSLRAFYRRYYQPDNALLIVAGTFDRELALNLIAREFGAIPRPERTLARTYTVEPVQDGERSVILRRSGDVAVVGAMYHALAGADPDWLGVDAIGDILTNQPSGRLYQALVASGLASEVWSTVYPTAEPGVILFGAKVRPGGAPDKVQKILLDTVERLGSSKIEPVELTRWQVKTRKQFKLELTNTSAIGVALSDYAAMGDWRLLFHTRDAVDRVSVADVTRLASNFLKASNRTTGLFLPEKTADRAPLPASTDVAALLKDYKPEAKADEAESFVASVDNIEARTQRAKLPSGLSLAFLPKKTKGGAVRLAITLRWGSAQDLQGQRAAAALLGPMLLRGSQQHSFQQLRDELDRLQAEVEVDSAHESSEMVNVTTLDVLTVRENLSAVIQLLAEIVQHPAFSPAEFESLRKERLAELEESLQDPMALGLTALRQHSYPWPRSDLRHMSSPSEQIEDLKRVTIADLKRLHRTLWGASAAQIALVGDLDQGAVRTQLEQAFDAWRASKPYARIERPFEAGEVKRDVIDTPDKQMAFVGAAQPLELGMDDADFPTMLLVNHILGGAANSRLLERLRQRDGVSYAAFSQLLAPPLDRSGSLFLGAMCAPQNADKAQAALLDEVARLLRDGVPERELADAKQSFAATWQTELADDEFVVTELNQGLFLQRTFAFWKGVNDKLQHVSAADLLAVARKHIKPEQLAQVKAGALHDAK
jgi:zinc protease